MKITTTMARLPDDVARFRGVGGDEEGWREGCERCASRLAPARGECASNMAPPPIIAGRCDGLIEIVMERRKVGNGK